MSGGGGATCQKNCYQKSTKTQEDDMAAFFIVLPRLQLQTPRLSCKRYEGDGVLFSINYGYIITRGTRIRTTPPHPPLLISMARIRCVASSRDSSYRIFDIRGQLLDRTSYTYNRVTKRMRGQHLQAHYYWHNKALISSIDNVSCIAVKLNVSDLLRLMVGGGFLIIVIYFLPFEKKGELVIQNFR